VTLDHPEMGRYLALVPLPERLRIVLSQEEVARLIEAAPGVKYKAAFAVAYGAGLRVSEVVHLKVSDIDSQRRLLRIEQGKGKKDRHALLSPQLLVLLRDYWWVAKPSTWLFPAIPCCP
jgi:integrase/recombinase XerD